MMLEKYPNMFSQYAKVAVGPARLEIIDIMLSEIERYQSIIDKEASAVNRYNDMLSKAKTGDYEALRNYYYNWPESYVEKKIKESKDATLKTVRKLDQQFRISKIKQFHGRIRVEYSGGDDYIRGLITATELISGTMCDLCGNPGNPYGEQWIYVSCDEHKDRDMHIKWYEDENE
jgi:hypothetical protein